jgi:hypothetical protein
MDCAVSRCVTQCKRICRCVPVGSTTSCDWMRSSSSRMVRGELPRSRVAAMSPGSSRGRRRGNKRGCGPGRDPHVEASDTRSVRPFACGTPPQPRELNVALPELLLVPISDIGTQQIAALGGCRPLVECWIVGDDKPKACGAALRLQADCKALRCRIRPICRWMMDWLSGLFDRAMALQCCFDAAGKLRVECRRADPASGTRSRSRGLNHWGRPVTPSNNFEMKATVVHFTRPFRKAQVSMEERHETTRDAPYSLYILTTSCPSAASLGRGQSKNSTRTTPARRSPTVYFEDEPGRRSAVKLVELISSRSDYRSSAL